MSLRLLGVAQTTSASRLVRIDGLTESDCAIDADQLPEEDDFDLWIGAIGPIRSSVAVRQQARAVVTFDTPLEREVVSHFLAR